MALIFWVAAVVLLAVIVIGSSVRIVRQFERGVVFRFGRVEPGTTRGPGIALLVPIADRMQKVNMLGGPR